MLKITDVLVSLDEHLFPDGHYLKLEDDAGNVYELEVEQPTADTVRDLMNQIEENQKLLSKAV
jgi:hypothetical protein